MTGCSRPITTPPTSTFGRGPEKDAIGYGIAAQGRIGLGQFVPALGRDEFTLMGFYGEGLGRYLAGNSFGLGAVSNIGLTGGGDYSLDTVPTYGGLAAYRRFWSPTLRSNLAYAYTRQDFPNYVNSFTPGSAAALSMNREMQQVITNIIWSLFAERTTPASPSAGSTSPGIRLEPARAGASRKAARKPRAPASRAAAKQTASWASASLGSDRRSHSASCILQPSLTNRRNISENIYFEL